MAIPAQPGSKVTPQAVQQVANKLQHSAAHSEQNLPRGARKAAIRNAGKNWVRQGGLVWRQRKFPRGGGSEVARGAGFAFSRLKTPPTPIAAGQNLSRTWTHKLSLRPKIGRLRQNLANFAPELANIAENESKSSQDWPDSPQSGRM